MEPIVVVGEAPEAALLFLSKEKALIPVSTSILLAAQGPRGEVTSRYIGSTLLLKDGRAFDIEEVRILGPYGNSMLRKLLSRLTDGWRVDVVLSERTDLDLKAVKMLVIEFLEAEKARVDSVLLEGKDASRVSEDVNRAGSAAEVFGALGIGPPEDLLDVL